MNKLMKIVDVKGLVLGRMQTLYKKLFPKKKAIDEEKIAKEIEEKFASAELTLDKIGIEALRIFYEEAKSRMEVLFQIKQSYRNRALAFLAFMMTLLPAVMGFIFEVTISDEVNMSVFLIIYIIIFASLILRASWACLQIVNTVITSVKGSDPQQFFEKEMWKAFTESDCQEKLALHKMCGLYAIKIATATEDNQQTGKAFNLAVRLLFWSSCFLLVFLSIILIDGTARDGIPLF